MMCLLKRVLPFTFTLIIGVGTWMLIEQFKPHTNNVTLSDVLHVSNHKQVYPSTNSYQLYNPYPPLSEDERVLLGAALESGYGFQHCNVVDIRLTRSSYYVAQWDGKIYRESAALKDATLLKVPQPNYWKDKDASDNGNIAILRLTLSATGEVMDIVPLSPTNLSEEHLEEVISAAKSIRFKPATEDGIPEDQKATILYKRGY